MNYKLHHDSQTTMESAMTLSELEWAHSYHSAVSCEDDIIDSSTGERLLSVNDKQLIYTKKDDNNRLMIESRLLIDNKHPLKLSNFIGKSNELDEASLNHLVVPKADLIVRDLDDNSLNTYTFYKNVDPLSKFLGGVAIIGRKFIRRDYCETGFAKRSHSNEYLHDTKILKQPEILKLRSLIPNYELVIS